MNDTALLPQASWQREATETTGPVFVRKYVSGAMLTWGYYPSARSAMLASDEAVWIPNGEHKWRSQDGRTVIEPEACEI
jgi:hypothetical protein